jgi:hypothetical protein
MTNKQWAALALTGYVCLFLSSWIGLYTDEQHDKQLAAVVDSAEVAQFKLRVAKAELAKSTFTLCSTARAYRFIAETNDRPVTDTDIDARLAAQRFTDKIWKEECSK